MPQYTPKHLTREEKRRRQYIQGCVTGLAAILAAMMLGVLVETSMAVKPEPAPVARPEVYLATSLDLPATPEPTPTPIAVPADVPLDTECWVALTETCEARGIDTSLALGLIYTESRFQEDAVSPAGCYGLAQLNPAYFPSGLSAADNIRAGLNYLGDLLEEYGDTGAALTGYNAGHDTGSRAYADAVLEAAEQWA